VVEGGVVDTEAVVEREVLQLWASFHQRQHHVGAYTGVIADMEKVQLRAVHAEGDGHIAVECIRIVRFAKRKFFQPRTDRDRTHKLFAVHDHTIRKIQSLDMSTYFLLQEVSDSTVPYARFDAQHRYVPVIYPRKVAFMNSVPHLSSVVYNCGAANELEKLLS
jgi:hypothetical protein